MKLRALVYLALLLPLAVVADTVVTRGDWALYRISSIISRHATEAACIQAADDTNELRNFTCRTITTITVTADTAPEPTPEPAPIPPGDVEPGDGGGGDGDGDSEPVPSGDGGGDGEPAPAPGDGDGSGETIPPPGSGDGDGGVPAPSPTPTPGPVADVESRCNDLGANCFCSEPLNTTSYFWTGDYANPADSTGKQCSYEVANSPLFVRSRLGGPSTNATALSRLPAGHNVRAFFASSTSGNGTIWLGTDRDMPANWRRFAMRVYLYYSSDYNFGDGSKLLQINNGLGQTMPVGQPGNTHQYGFNGHTFSGGVMGDCCSAGPPTGVDPGASGLVGKWWRFEYVVSNPAGPGVRYQLYAKNVTNNAPEFLLIDSGVPCSACRPNPAGLGAPDLRPSAQIRRIVGNLYRQGSGQTGFRGASHLLYAGWDTNAGQRIGAAPEIE